MIRPTAVPSADFFEAGESFFSNIENLGLAGIAAIIVVVLVKQVMKAPTVMASVAAIAAAIFVGWLAQQYNNSDVNEVFDETVTDTVGAPATPATTPQGGSS